MPSIDLRPDEQIIWQSVQPYQSQGQIAPDSSYPALKSAILAFSLALAIYLSSFWLDLEPVPEMIWIFVAVMVFAHGVYRLSQSPFFVRFNHFTVIMHAPSFVSCVITDRRVLLFNQLGESPTALSRGRLASTTIDYVEGSRALLMKSHGDRHTYAWLHASDFTAALDALGHPNLSKRGSP